VLIRIEPRRPALRAKAISLSLSPIIKVWLARS
jgi:hypothetical protein